MANISDIYRGDSRVIRVTMESGVFDGGKAWFTLKKEDSYPDETAEIQQSASVALDSDTGLYTATINLLPDTTNVDPGRYYYDVQLVSSDQTVVHTALAGRLTVHTDITRRTA